MSPLWAFVVILSGLFVGSIDARSDEFGRNPQHDFGSVVGSRKFSSVLPFWTMLGDAFANEDFVRLTPDRQSKSGAVWNSQRLAWKSWELIVQFNINGISKVGADGFGIWLAREVNVLGKFFGFDERFTGIGVVVDTYDNDGSGTHPLVSLFQNDGTKSYEHSHADGHHKASDMELGSCSYPNIRNQAQNTLVKITYQHSTVTIQLKADGDRSWRECVVAPDVKIETGMYLGMTAATGHLADNHDIRGVTIRNLDPDAKYFDSESRFAQFSKYTIAESLGRVEADIRGTLYQASGTPQAAAAGSSYPADLSQELNSLKREIALVSQKLRDSPPSVPQAQNRYQQQQQQQSQPQYEETIRRAISPLENSVRDVKATSYDSKKGISSVSAELDKLNEIESKLTKVVSNLQEKQKEEVIVTSIPIEEEDDSVLTIFNFLFFVLCLFTAYLAFTLYRVQASSRPVLSKGV